VLNAFAVSTKRLNQRRRRSRFATRFGRCGVASAIATALVAAGITFTAARVFAESGAGEAVVGGGGGSGVAQCFRSDCERNEAGDPCSTSCSPGFTCACKPQSCVTRTPDDGGASSFITRLQCMSINPCEGNAFIDVCQGKQRDDACTNPVSGQIGECRPLLCSTLEIDGRYRDVLSPLHCLFPLPSDASADGSSNNTDANSPSSSAKGEGCTCGSTTTPSTSGVALGGISVVALVAFLLRRRRRGVVRP
jgi:MYXO-CTERM domain-containing protein